MFSQIEVKPRKEECRCVNCRQFYNIELGTFDERCSEREFPSFSVCKKYKQNSGIEGKNFNYTAITIVFSVICLCVVLGFYIYKKHKTAEISNTVSYVNLFLYFSKIFYINLKQTLKLKKNNFFMF